MPGAISPVPQKGAGNAGFSSTEQFHTAEVLKHQEEGGEIMINRENVNFTVRRAKAALKKMWILLLILSPGAGTSDCTHLLPSPALPEDNNSLPTIQVAPEPHLLHVCKLLRPLSLKHRIK